MDKKIKKINLIVSCLLLFALSDSFAKADGVKSAEDDDSMPRIGIELGINISSLNNLNVNNIFASRFGFGGCSFSNLPLGTSFSSHPKLLLEQNNGNLDENPYQLNYEEVPILFDVALGMPTFNLGILMGVSIDSRVSFQGVNRIQHNTGTQLAEFHQQAQP